MKISLITVSFNSALTIKDTIESVLSQDYKNIEYIIVDGKSSDGTVAIIQSYQNKISNWISEPDKGIYDAMNKAISMAKGEVVGILNSDDFYANNQIISKVAEAFEDNTIDIVFADLNIVDPDNVERIVRRYSSKTWHPTKFALGFMPAHPTVFVRRKYYQQFGLFNTAYRIASDYELLIRLLYVHKLKYKYLPMTLVVMRKGGASSSGIRSNLLLNKEILQACRENGISTNYFLIYSKYFSKVFELIG